MNRKAKIVVWNLILVFALFVLSGYFPANVALAHSTNDEPTPFVKDAPPLRLKHLLDILQPRIKKELSAAPEEFKTSMSLKNIAEVRTIPLQRLFFDEEKRLVIDLGKNAKKFGNTNFKILAHYIRSIVNEELYNQGYSLDYMSYYFEIDGIGVENVFRPVPAKPDPKQRTDSSQGQDAPPSLGTFVGDTSNLQTNVSVNGHRVALNPGHGYYYNGSTWVHYGASYGGVQEDNLNVDMAAKLNQALKDAGVSVIPIRELDDRSLNSNSSLNNSPIKWWEMGAGEYAKTRLHQPDWVSNTGSNPENRDVNARPFLSNAMNAEIMVSIHNNASQWPLWGPEWCGSVVFYDTSNSSWSQSSALAGKIADKMNNLKSSYSWWCGSAIQGTNDNGENTWFYGPAVIVEVGDLRNKDVRENLNHADFQTDAMNRVKDGVVDYYTSLPVSCPSPSSYTWRVQYWTAPPFLIPYNQPFYGNAVVCQSETTINHNWGNGGPSGVTTDRFSLRATSTQYFTAGRYRFHLGGDDGVRLSIDGGLPKIDRWKNQSYTEYTYDTDLNSGNHSMMLEYYEDTSGAAVKLWWELLCPNGQYAAEYYNNRSLDGKFTFTRCEGSPINMNWGSGGPGNGVGNDNFSARWTGQFNINAGTYDFVARADDGVRVWLDGNIIIDKWVDQPVTEYRVTRTIGSGNHTIKMEYYENAGGAVAQLRWEPVSSACPNQYHAEYFNNRSLSGNSTFSRCENWPINFNWGSGGPGNGIGNDNFSVRWLGQAYINPGTYAFIARADDGVNVWLDGNKIIDQWKDQPVTEYRSPRTVGAGVHAIKVEYYENGGGAVAQFRWEPTSSNLALNAPRWATSQENSKYPPYYANDGSTASWSRWSSAQNNNDQWWIVDVGNAQNFDTVVIRWEWAFAPSHFVGWSNDGINFNGYWYEIPSAGNYRYDLGARNARYVGILMRQHAACCGNFSFWEFEVYRNLFGFSKPQQELMNSLKLLTPNGKLQNIQVPSSLLPTILPAISLPNSTPEVTPTPDAAWDIVPDVTPTFDLNTTPEP